MSPSSPHSALLLPIPTPSLWHMSPSPRHPCTSHSRPLTVPIYSCTKRTTAIYYKVFASNLLRSTAKCSYNYLQLQYMNQKKTVQQYEHLEQEYPHSIIDKLLMQYHHLKVKRLKVRTIIYLRLQGNQTSSGLQYKVAYWPPLAVGSAAQLATAHCPNERT